MIYRDIVVKAMKLSGIASAHDNEQDSDAVSRNFNILKDLITSYNADANITFEKDVVRLQVKNRKCVFGLPPEPEPPEPEPEPEPGQTAYILTEDSRLAMTEDENFLTTESV